MKQQIPPPDQEEILAIRELTERSYFEFFCEFWPCVVPDVPLKLNFHIKYICDELQKVAERVFELQPKEYDLVINVPPGTSKTNMVSILFQIWCWVRMPTLRFIMVSHTGTLSQTIAEFTRDGIEAPYFQLIWGHVVTIRPDTDAKKFFRTVAGGFRLSTSVGAKITGNHAHFLIMDDNSDPKGVRSVAEMEATNMFVNKTLSNRKVDKEVSVTINMQQRLHELDTSGDMLEQAKKVDENGNIIKPVKHICLPATDDWPIFPADDVVEFEGLRMTIAQWYEYQGGYLDPVRQGPKVLAEQELELGQREYAGQYGQQPRLLEGNLIKNHHLPVVERYQVPQEVFDIGHKQFVGDTAQKAKQENDFNGILRWVEFDGYLYLLDYLEKRASPSETCRLFGQFIDKDKSWNSLLHIEPKASGHTVIEHFQNNTDIPTKEFDMIRTAGGHEASKIQRVNAIEPFLDAGRVFLINGPWVENFKNKCTGFPNMAHDEPVDCLVMACWLAFNGPKRERSTVKGVRN